ncbi:hypothetical protein [Neolewinella persica]|uniref:hypothetical protein n=1 Tax=Neolewinella persica TaxID=70998 RepID=UPI00037588E2|nr:hypothetical protein [Neolewinella persica]
MQNSSTPYARIALLLIFSAMAITSLVRNEVFQGTTNVINWDGYGYYAYLPGAFVYGDISEYAFAEDHFSSYEVSSGIYQLMELENGSRFPIYNIGLAVVWTPAFLITHSITAVTGIAAADGMSYPYQLMVALMMLLFAFLGLLNLKRFLAIYFSDVVVALVLLGIGLGTNIFYYIVENPDMTHGYLFALYAMFLYAFARGFCSPALVPDGAVHGTSAGEQESFPGGKRKYLIYCGLLAGLMCLIRSSEIVVFAIPAFYGLKNWATLKRNFWRTLPIFGIALAVFSIQLIYYKAGTGSWWQNGYAGLGFDWLSPHLYEGFIGYRRGWLVYTPLMAFALMGIAWLRKDWLLPILIFTLGNVYLLFSWHIWWYGDTFGSRPVTQSYAVLALPLGALLTWLVGGAAGARERIKGAKEEGAGNAPRRRFIAPLLLLALIPFIALNLFQHWQYNQRILPLDFVNKTYYWHVFGKAELDKHDRVFLDINEKIPDGKLTYTPLPGINEPLAVPPKARQEFVNILEEDLILGYPDQVMWLRGNIHYSYFGDSFDKWKFPSVVMEHKRDGGAKKWIQVNIPRAMATPTRDSLKFNISLEDIQSGDKVKLYFWNLSQDSLMVHWGDFKLLHE